MTVQTTYTVDDVAEAFRAGLELGRRTAQRPSLPGDGGFAEAFLQRQLAARAALDDDRPVVGIDPETIAAARSIARLLQEAGR